MSQWTPDAIAKIFVILYGSYMNALLQLRAKEDTLKKLKEENNNVNAFRISEAQALVVMSQGCLALERIPFIKFPEMLPPPFKQ